MKNVYTSLALVLLMTTSAFAQTALTFTALSALPDGGRYGMGYTQDQTSLYMVGGGNPQSAFNASVYRFDLALGSWELASASTGLTPQRWASAVIAPDATGANVLYVLNGADTFTSPTTAVQTVTLPNGAIGPSFTNATPASTAGVAVLNGMVYAFGGQLAGGAFTAALRRFNPSTNTWTTLAPLPEAKATTGAAVNGKIYAIGGFNGVVNSARVDAYDPATNSWQALGTLPTTVSSQAVAVQGEWIWMVGDFTAQQYLAAYNTRTGQVRTFTSNLPPRRNAAAAFHNNRLYVWGGNTASANSSTRADMWSADVSTILANQAETATALGLRAYPNPSADGFTTLTLPSGTQLVNVFDGLGRQVLSVTPAPTATSLRLSLRSQAAGLYTVRVHTMTGQQASCRVVRP